MKFRSQEVARVSAVGGDKCLLQKQKQKQKKTKHTKQNKTKQNKKKNK